MYTSLFVRIRPNLKTYKPEHAAQTYPLENFTDEPPMSLHWNTEEVLFDGDLFFERMLSDIKSAQQEISVEVYIFSPDELGNRVLEALSEASQRGVKVQVLVDGVGSYQFFDHLFGQLQSSGVDVKVYNPLPFYHPFIGNLSLKRKIKIFFQRFARLNKRDHRKIIIIDQKILYIGSFNITAEHTSLSPVKKWKDIGARVTGEYVLEAVLQFKKTFHAQDFRSFKKSFKKKFKRTTPLFFSPAILSRKTFKRERFDRVKKAQQHIWLMTPYFIPAPRQVRALALAAKRGVDVRLLTNLKSDVEIFRTLQFIYYEYLIKNGVKIYQYTDTILHAKTYVIDDWVSIGSSNLNQRSLIHDLEADLILEDPVNQDLVKRDFEKSLLGLAPLDQEFLNKRPYWDKFLSQLFYLFRYWL
jgi:cardiolipin synthase A/B